MFCYFQCSLRDEDEEFLRMRETEAALRAELRELREHNELLEFRLLEKVRFYIFSYAEAPC